jgi:hypothetical protein
MVVKSMIELKAKFNNAKVFTDNIDAETISQIMLLLNQEFAKDNKIRIMPDTQQVLYLCDFMLSDVFIPLLQSKSGYK